MDGSTLKYTRAALRNTVSWEEEGERDREDEELIMKLRRRAEKGVQGEFTWKE